MIRKYKEVAIVYGGSGKKYAAALHDRITQIAEKDRYPLSATIIMQQILTRELLSDVIGLFKDSEFCVAFLTADDCFTTDFGGVRRLRQNVVFEIGMALIQLGRERCILLSDFDVRSPEFQLPTDMNSLEILSFQAASLEATLDAVIVKLLQFSQESVITGVGSESIPRYDNLLLREDYYVDYENIFADRPLTLAAEGKRFFLDTLSLWLRECKKLPHYDEKCIYLLERIGFLPIFGQTKEVKDFMAGVEELVENYQLSDIRYYDSNVELLNFLRNLVSCMIRYTSIKVNDRNAPGFQYEVLLHSMLSEPLSTDVLVNPLISVVYYDYLGLMYFRLYRANQTPEDLSAAREAFETALEYVKKVDMSLQVWSGFLQYNLARVYRELGDFAKAKERFLKAIQIRHNWLRNSRYNVTVRNALSYEYFIAKIDYIDMCRKSKVLSEDDSQKEYRFLENELDAYSDVDDETNQLQFIRSLLKERKSV